MSPSKSEAAYQLVSERITNGAYSPGYRLVLGTIAAELGCSVVPVREAIRRLEAEGLVHFTRNVGATVAHVDSTLYLHTMQTLMIIEPAATALAADAMDAAWLAQARELNDKMRQCLEDFDPVAFTRMNTEFHQLLYGQCPNPHILDLVQRGWRRLAAMRASSFTHIPNRAKASVAEHDALLDLIAGHATPAQIETAAREHRANTLNAYLQAAGMPPSVI
ncbi:GntR family transcriptional regulator [Glutamicibacter uratoxydans]|uniref:GntR family transcriptional regulator n=1 Tax=Glutamicibacter uratoxydans TaxID=43667 RepID=A0A4Y4DK39_GLUUR|nr:GntR family transcriptional regulator [Glutamicibacter uratoxydans]GED05679.1 GntR family transcriptional regulator [Glutamicibacter uratoxydans]